MCVNGWCVRISYAYGTINYLSDFVIVFNLNTERVYLICQLPFVILCAGSPNMLETIIEHKLRNVCSSLSEFRDILL